MKNLLFILAIALLTSCTTDVVQVPVEKSTYELNGVIYRHAPKEIRHTNHCQTGRPILWDDQMQMFWEFGKHTITYSYDDAGDSCISHLDLWMPKKDFKELGFEGEASIVIDTSK